MKKKILVLLAAVSVAMLAGCSNPGSTKNLDLAKYKGVEYVKVETEVTDDDVEQYMQSVVDEYNSNPVAVDRAAVDGDTVNIDFVGKVDGEEFENGSGTGYDLVLGSNSFIDGFEEGLVGVKTGDEIDVNVTFPEDYGTETLNGKDAVFSVKVNSVSANPTETLTDDFVKLVSETSTTVDEYREEVRGLLVQNAADSDEQQMKSDIWSRIIYESTVKTYPDDMIEEAKVSFDEYYQQYADMFGVDLTTLITSYCGWTQDQYDEYQLESAQASVKEELVLNAIAAEEGIEISDEEYTEGAAKYADNYGYETQEFIDTYGEEMIKSSLLYDKILDFLVSEAVEVDSTEAMTEDSDTSTEEATTEAATEAATEEVVSE